MGWQRGPLRDRLRDARNGSPTDPPPPCEISSLADKREQLISLKVEFADAANSSLDYAIIADFDGSLAHHYEFITRALLRLAVDCCLANHREIPFTQITLHNAYPSTSPPSHERPAAKAKLP